MINEQNYSNSNMHLKWIEFDTIYTNNKYLAVTWTLYLKYICYEMEHFSMQLKHFILSQKHTKPSCSVPIMNNHD